IQRQQRLARYFTEDLGNGITLDMAAIPSGTFIMGAPETEERSSNWERPQHQVTIKPFFISKYPITEAQWKAVAALHKDTFRPLYPYVDEFQGENHPVTNIRFDDAVEFCNRLSNYTGQIYRLPSEAEWEYACRAGTNTPFYFGETITTDLANYDGHRTYGNAPKGEYRPKTTPVGSFPPNGFGLYDMHGNVREWCADRFYTGYHDSYKGAPTDGSVWIGDDDVCPVVRDSSLEEYMQDHGFKSYDDFCPVVRGGSRLDPPVCCRSACRDSSGRFGRSSFHGFRIVMIALGTL
ncbi:formylglycine-generating enzyme family protein, partial [Nostoc sp.]